MVDILCLGEPLFELNAQPDGSFKPGYGGDVSNVAVAAARQGADVGLISRVGDDPFGAELLDLWQREAVNAEHVPVMQNQNTGLYFVFHDDEGHQFIYRRHGSAASQLEAADIPERGISGSRIFYTSGITLAVSSSLRSAAFHALNIAKNSGTTVAFDPNLRTKLWELQQARVITHCFMCRCDIALPGLDDARKLTGLQSPESIIGFYHNLGAKVVALTLGADGVAVSDGDSLAIIAGTPVDAKDATGAGDCFNGIFLANYLQHGDVFKSAEIANRGAALSTTGYGAVDPIPFKSMLERERTRSHGK